MKNPFLTIFAFCALLISLPGCGKKEPEEMIEEKPKPVVFPIKLNRTAIENIEPLRVFIRGSFPGPTFIEINSTGLAILQDEVFKDPNLQTKMSIDFLTGQNFKYNWKLSCGQTGSYADTGDGYFHFTIGSSGLTSCWGGSFRAKGSYDELVVPGQSYVSYRQGKRSAYEGVRDYYFFEQAGDTFPGDTIAILNYDMRFK